MGGIGSGRKPKDNNRSLTEQTTYESGPAAARFLKEVVDGKTMPDPDRIRAAIDTRNQVMGKPVQSHELGLQEETTRAALELQAKLLEARPKGGDNGSNGEGEEGLPEGVYAKEEV